MKEREERQQPQEPDPHLDVPAEANREKHINFLDVEEESANRSNRRREDDFSRERRQQWQEGLEEGRKARAADTQKTSSESSARQDAPMDEDDIWGLA